MSTPEYDAREVLDKYLATLNKPGHHIIRDSRELAYPKDIIKFVLQHCIKTIVETDKLSFLRKVYLSLGNFQELNDEERKAVVLLNTVGPLGPPGTDAQEEQATRISNVAAPLQAIMDRLRSEVAVLAQELKALPGTD